jgi:hypothetical protein
MEVCVSATDDEVEAEGEQEQASDDVEDDSRDLFLAGLFPVLLVRGLSGLGVDPFDVSLGHVC